jgi:hypothetical protein
MHMGMERKVRGKCRGRGTTVEICENLFENIPTPGSRMLVENATFRLVFIVCNTSLY